MRISPSNEPIVIITMGDRKGVGPEVIAGALSDESIRKMADFVVIGDAPTMEDALKLARTSLPIGRITFEKFIVSGKAAIDKNAITVLDMEPREDARDPLRYIDCAVKLIQEKRAQALVTAPVNKELITRSGVKFAGHTEYIARLTGTARFAMMFIAGRYRVTLVTRHIPLKAVSAALTRQKIIDAVRLTHDFMKEHLSLPAPVIGVCGLNPHAGEGGLIGREEKNVILPAINVLRRVIKDIKGPIPADSAFGLLMKGDIDCLISMYHDQAMIPLKTSAQKECVNVTLGLPFIRTSPAHGTAYDIAWKGVADPSSMKEAMRLACRLSSS